MISIQEHVTKTYYHAYQAHALATALIGENDPLTLALLGMKQEALGMIEAVRPLRDMAHEMATDTREAVPA